MSCAIEGCEALGKLHVNGNRYLIKGYCQRHYQNVYRHNDAEHIPVHPGSPGERSDEFKQECSQRMMGNKLHTMPHTLETKIKISLINKGRFAKEKNPNWKGGTYGNERQKYMQTSEYRIWRKLVFARDNYTCVLCGASGVYIEADHIKRYADYPELRITISNGRTLCKPCHKEITFMKKDIL